MWEGSQTFLKFVRDTLPKLQTEEGREYVRKRIRELEDGPNRDATEKDGVGIDNQLG